MKWRVMHPFNKGICQKCGKWRERNMLEIQTAKGMTAIQCYCLECHRALGESEGDPRE